MPDHPEKDRQEKTKGDQENKQIVDGNRLVEKSHRKAKKDKRIQGVDLLLGMNILSGYDLGISQKTEKE